MFELSKMFLICLNYWKLETPTQYRQRTQKDDATAYKLDYTRCVHTFFSILFEFLSIQISSFYKYIINRIHDSSVYHHCCQVVVLLPRPTK